MKVVKFGGSSLANGQNVEQALNIIFVNCNNNLNTFV